jgi:signal transduction histidine kinase
MNRLWLKLTLAFGVVIFISNLAFPIVTLAWNFMSPETRLFIIRPVSSAELPLDETTRQLLIQEQVVRTLISIGIVTAATAVIAGIFISRTLTNPLTELASAAKELGQKNLERRVVPRGTDETRALAVAFNDMGERLQTAETLRRNLLADVAHELRTPLTVLQGNLRAILDDVYPLDKEEITRLYDQSRHLHRLVNDLHELAQADANQLPLHRQSTDVDKLVQMAVTMIEPLADEKTIKVAISNGTALPNVEVDQARLTQAVQNLLTNAVRHTPEGGTISVQVSQADNALQIAVQDTGEGIAPEHLPFVWDRFYRTDRTRDRHTGGTGLGLAIVRGIVEAHGGTVSATSEGIGKGSTFGMELPLNQPAPVTTT